MYWLVPFRKFCLAITSKGVQGDNRQISIGCLKCSIQARNITNIEGLGVFEQEENKVNNIDNNLPPWVEVEGGLEDSEASEGAEAQE